MALSVSLAAAPLADPRRSYIQRRAREEFHAISSGVRDQAAADAAWGHAASELEVWKRQALVYGLYGRKVKNVLELDGAGK